MKTGDGVGIRHFCRTEEDLRALRESYRPGAGADETAKMIDEWNALRCNGRFFEMFAVTAGDTVVGTVSLYQLSPSVVSIGPEIFPAFRRRGYGSRAVELASAAASEKGYRIACQQVRADNAASRALHEKLGFETDGYVYRNRKDREVVLYLKTLRS